MMRPPPELITVFLLVVSALITPTRAQTSNPHGAREFENLGFNHAKFENPTNGSWWIVQMLSKKGKLSRSFESHQRELVDCSDGILATLTRSSFREDLNDPPTPVGGISSLQRQQPVDATAPQLTSIATYTAEVDRYIKVNRKRVFGDISSASSTGPSNWKEFKSEAAREKAETGDNLNQNAFVWTRQGKVIGANFTFTSPSGDWAHLVMYYFREDGSLARIKAQLNTFYGELSIVRERFYSADGRPLKSSKKFLDLKTKKPKKPGKDFFDKEFPIFANVSALPFHKLL